jgi:hypothetical protein
MGNYWDMIRGKITYETYKERESSKSNTSSSNSKSLLDSNNKENTGGFSVYDTSTGKLVRQGSSGTGGSGLPSIAPPTQEQIDEYNASQGLGKVDEAVLKQELAKPTQTLVQKFMSPGVSSESFSTARQALNKPLTQRSFAEQKAIVETASVIGGYDAGVQLKQKQQQNFTQRINAVNSGQTLADKLGGSPQQFYDARTLEQKPTVLQKPLNAGYIQGQQVASAIASVPGQIYSGAKESLIDIPFAFGRSVREESKGNILAVPGVVGGKIAGAALFVATNPQKVLTGTIESVLISPAKFSTQFALNALALKGLGTVVKAGYGKVTTIGKKFIPESELVVPEVTSGLKNFPTTKNPVTALKEFNKTKYATATGQKMVYSASNFPFIPGLGRNITISSGRGLVKSVDVPGLYTSTKGVSTYFLRLKQGLSQYKLLPGSLKEILPSQSKILAIPRIPARIPAAFRTSLEKAQSFFGKKNLTLTKPLGKPGKPYFSPALEFGLKNEAEAVIQIGSKFKRVGMNTVWEKVTGFSKYTKINGEVVPIYELKFVGKGLVKGAGQKVSVVDYASSSSGIVKKSLISPSSVVSGIKVSSVSNVSKSSSSFSNTKKIASFSSSSKASVDKFVSSYAPSTKSLVSSVKIESGGKSSFTSRGSSGASSSSIVPTPSYIPEPKITESRITPSSRKLIPSYNIPAPKKSFTYIPTTKYTVPTVSQIKSSKTTFSYYKPKLLKVGKGFSVSTRVKGKEKLLAFNVPKNLAVAIGRRFTGGTTARSFKIKQVGFTSKKDIGLQNLFEYRKPVAFGKVGREGFTFVEKSKFAIDTIGEVKGLKAGKFKAKIFK